MLHAFRPCISFKNQPVGGRILAMLSQLTIKNFGLIDKLTVEPCKGLNVFTGMTGAGKSILIDALRCALGERFNSSFVRDPQAPSVIEAVFDLDKAFLKERPDLAEYLENDDVLVVRRTFLSDGKTKNTINDLNVPLSRLKELGDNLVDLHGPHDHQMLFMESSHIGILDRLSDIGKEKDKYLAAYSEFKRAFDELERIKTLSQSRDRDIDLFSHQIKELEQVSLDDADYEKTVQDDARVNNAEKLHECVSALISALDDDAGVSSGVSGMFRHLEELNKIDEHTSDLAEILSRVQEDVSTLSAELNSYMEKLDFEPGMAEETARRMDIYTDILRKYGPDLSAARTFYASLKEKYGMLVDIEHNTAELEKKIAAARKSAMTAASLLTAKRLKTAGALKKTIEKELEELGINKVRFECRITGSELGPDGADKAVFYISPNVGEELKPLAEIVSSGEAARVMLALKKALTNVDPVPVLVFDEIDAQIGGRLGTVTGKKLKELSDGRQVLLITHLPQIASFGEKHFNVTKSVRGSRTETEVVVLEGDTRVKELARMMSGEKETEIAVKHAETMLAEAKRG